MDGQVKIEQVDSVDGHLDELISLLTEVVADGASIGFLPPLPQLAAEVYWNGVCSEEVMLYAAKVNGQIVGSVQLQLCMKQNGLHRAEIAKLMTLPAFRRQGIGRLLMQRAEERAVQAGRSLLVIDTREGDASNYLYAAIGYIEAGRIPEYAKSADGGLDATIMYYKMIGK